MSSIEKATGKKAVLSLKNTVQEMPIDMRLFSLTMRSLYAEKAVGTNEEIAQKFRDLRDATRNDAMVYLKGVLPLSTNLVAALSEYFECYDALTLEEWVEMLPDILEQTTGYRQLAESMVKIHEDIIVPLKKREDEAKLLIASSELLEKKFNDMEKKCKDRAANKRSWSFYLSFVPAVGTIASSILEGEAQKDYAEACADAAHSQIVHAAAMAVKGALIPALEAFIDGITKAAGFFSVMEQELKMFEGKAEKAETDPRKLYYLLMKKEAKDMKEICRAFYAVLPAVRTDFLAIPTEGTDQNHIDRWLEKQRKILKEKVTVGKLLTVILKAIDGGTAASPPDTLTE